MPRSSLRRAAVASALSLLFCYAASAQSGATRPRRVSPDEPTVQTPVDGKTAPARPVTSASSSPPLTLGRPVTNASSGSAAVSPSGGAAGTTARAYTLLQQKQHAAALAEARQLTTSDPRNAEAWKIAGFAEMNLKQYDAAATDLQRALELQRAAGEEDANTVDALAQAYVRTEKFEQALPLLVTATTRPAAKATGNASSAEKPEPLLLYYRGLAEYRTGKLAEAESSFNAAIKADPKNGAALFYLGRLAYDRNDLDAAIASFNRATLNDSQMASAWALLATAYMRRAAAASVPAKAEADYLNAVRAGEGLNRVARDETAAALLAQALIGANQYARAVTVLERVAAAEGAQGSTLYLLGVSYSRTKNYPKAIQALERARAKTPEDANLYRELGYAYEVSKQYAKALSAYQKGAELVPDDADFKASVERVRPFAK